MSSFVITVGAGVLVLLATLSLFPVLAQPVDKDAIKEAAKEVIMECKSKAGASDADIQALKDHKMPESHEGLCMLECIFDSSKIMENGKFSKSGMIEGFKPLVGEDQEKQERLSQLASTCENEIGDGDSDKCQTAKLLVECIIKNGKTHGFEMPTAVKK
ncbi:hypothetical protein MTP99_010621 [Tenebrio molitor]|uniref:general odorant-binding protein 19d-like isoform X2 n=1 Tax=Tenebrio molitor TaxID=7067 RepID=UPI002701A891|nr:hypothetical protein MTP99_010621 [Tenebrio molitor]